ncbi:MAG: hypothetical protein L3K17_02900 [Thermoplasmata archaeon]|nr:hypothetical protein [Thermoplasmata archaeon]
MLFVKCHACGHPFPSGIAHAEVDIGKVQMLGILERCPNCKNESRYDTHEFFFPKGVTDPEDRAIGPGLPEEAQRAPEPVPPEETPEPAGNRDRSPNLTP